MASMTDPLVKKVAKLVQDYSVPDVVEALLAIAQHYKLALKKEQNGEWRSWSVIEKELGKALKAID